MPVETLKSALRDVPDFPKKGVLFKDITPVLASPQLFALAIDQMVSGYQNSNIDKIVGIDARGFIFGAAMASRLRCGFVPVRKAGKLPWSTLKESYSLEYGEDSLELHKDAIAKGDKVLIVDDLLATGGTAFAAAKLVERLGGRLVGIQFFIELGFLNGRERLAAFSVRSTLQI